MLVGSGLLLDPLFLFSHGTRFLANIYDSLMVPRKGMSFGCEYNYCGVRHHTSDGDVVSVSEAPESSCNGLWLS